MMPNVQAKPASAESIVNRNHETTAGFDWQRTGVAANYKNIAIGWQHWFSPQIEIRPEIAYYHSSGLSFNGSANEGVAPNRRTETVISGDG